MEQLLKFRRLCINVAEEYAFIFLPLLKFAVAYLAFSTINAQIGYMERLDNMFILLAMALLSAVLPNMVMIMLAAALLIIQSYGVHLFAFVFVVLMLLLLYIFLQRFSGKYSLLLILTPMAVHLGLAPLVPVVGGLLLGPAALLPVCSGTLIYSVIAVVAESAQAVHGVEIKEFTMVITQLLDGLMARTDTVLLLIIMASVFLVVYALRRLSVPYAWQIALFCGAAAFLALLFVGGFFMETTLTVGSMLPGILAAIVIGEAVTFFCWGLEYKKTQRLQFEDDDYYYYVKAVPKVDGISMSAGREMEEQGNPLSATEKENASDSGMQQPVRRLEQDVQIDDLEAKLEKTMEQIQE